MKFSDISKEQWDELKPYLDTCLLPVTGMSGKETPFEATECLERLRDMMDLVEIPFRGRVVTYPAAHYITDHDSMDASLERWCGQLKTIGFQYVILVTANESLELRCTEADLVLQPGVGGSLPDGAEVSSQIRELWSKPSP